MEWKNKKNRSTEKITSVRQSQRNIQGRNIKMI